MKERPILFSGPMVRAILEGRKTQTRRIMKPQPTTEPIDRSEWKCGPFENPCPPHLFPFRRPDPDRSNYAFACPYGTPGDRLWVRETHAIAGQLVAYDADGWCGAVCDDGGGGRLRIPHGFVSTTGSDAIRRGCADKNGARFGMGRFGGRWRPSIHMPRRASRITLEVTAVRVERLQEISEDDAQAEGVDRYAAACDHPRFGCDEIGCLGVTHRASYAALWDDINGDRAAWASNPWVWVVEFKRIGGAS